MVSAKWYSVSRAPRLIDHVIQIQKAFRMFLKKKLSCKKFLAESAAIEICVHAKM